MKGRPIRAGDPVVLNRSGRCIGQATSAVVLGEGQIGMAYVERRYADVGTDLSIFPRSVGARRQAVKPEAPLAVGQPVHLA